MTRLQISIAGILIGAIGLVVAVSTLVAFLAITYPLPERMAAPVASQIKALSRIFEGNPSALSDLTSGASLSYGPELPDLTAAVTARLEAAGVTWPVTVYETADGGTPVAIAEIGGGRITIDFPGDFHPPLDFWVILGAWLGLMVVGVIGVSLFMAYRVTRPFAVLERAVATVGPDGILPHIPESGSREVAETARMLNRLSDRLRTAMESRMRLVAAAGHDFRTPMTRMRLRVEFLDDEERAAWLKDIDELERIADSAIGLVREEVSDNAHEPVALDQLLTGEVEDLVEHGYDLRVSRLDPVTLPLPPLAIRRAIRNLLINAATHGHGGDVQLVADDAEATILITDDGPGIPEDLMQQVFEPFFRASPGRMQTIPGAGLGLALASEIIERIGGTLTLRNRAEGGLLQTIVIGRKPA